MRIYEIKNKYPPFAPIKHKIKFSMIIRNAVRLVKHTSSSNRLTLKLTKYINTFIKINAIFILMEIKYTRTVLKQQKQLELIPVNTCY